MVQLHLLHVLFTPYERVQPWRLYLMPRIGLGKILHILTPRESPFALGSCGAEMDMIGPLGE
ncbi:hypothetical protein BS47DRAFT_1343332 [Hydnum rufescens UP504]|uniref:Uncharacterized protein n=1 Tax=Hydnum rufescens UP504 TaxID=1448309 RepID=A0A9P6B0P9_9AGAM|nr:hypothetical protein BS47DRAFT_1343332 [Hydnum rufescens UP504]